MHPQNEKLQDYSVQEKFISLDQEKNNLGEFVEIMTETIYKIFKLLQGSETVGYQSVIGFDKKTFPLVKKRFGLEAFPEKGESVQDFFQDIDQKIQPFVSPGSPNYFGHMLPALNMSAIIADTVANILNQNVIAEHVAPSLTYMENQVVGYLADLIGYEQDKAVGAIVSGGTTANHTALLVARNKSLPGVAEKGVTKALQDYNGIHGTKYSDIAILSGEDSHYSIEKLASYVGVGSEGNHKIAYLNDQMDPVKLDAKIRELKQKNVLPIAIVATAGSTEKGHIDDLKAIAQVAKEHKVYLHIDAAHGGGFLVDPELKAKYFQGIEEADSVTIDGQKMLYTNYSCGGIIFKNRFYREYLKQSARYVLDTQDEEVENHGKYTIEGSRGGSGILQLWSSIRTFGKEGYLKINQQLLTRTQEFRDILLKNSNFEILSGESPLNLVCFRYVNPCFSEGALNELNRLLAKEIFQDGEFFVSNSTIDGKNCFRVVIMNLSTEKKHLQAFLSKCNQIVSEQIEITEVKTKELV